VVVLKFVLIAAVTAAASIPLPHVLLEVIWYSSPNLPTWRGAHGHHRLSPLDAPLFALTANNQQGVDLAAVEAIVVPVEAALELPEVPIGGRKARRQADFADEPGLPPTPPLSVSA